MLLEKIKLQTKDNITLEGNLYNSGKSKVIIIAHGFYQNKDTRSFKKIAKLLSPYYDVISMDFRGHGKSKGLFTFTAKETQDLICFLNFAKNKYQKIGVIGFSLGAAISIISASKTDLINSLIAVSPPENFWKINYHIWKKEAMQNLLYNLSPKGNGKGIRPGNVFLKKSKPIDCISSLNETPVFFIHGKKDWLIHPNHSKNLFKKAKGTKKIKIIDDATHAEMIYEEYPEEFKNYILSWFDETLN